MNQTDNYTPRGVAQWREERGAATRSLPKRGMASDLVEAESLLGITLPSPIRNALSDYTVLYTEMEGPAVERLGAARESVNSAAADRRGADALAIADAVRKDGIESFVALSTIIEKPETDLVAIAARDLELAERTHLGIVTAGKGLLSYIQGLCKSEAGYLDILDRAWTQYATVTPEESWTLGELAAAEAMRDSSLPLFERLALVAEPKSLKLGPKADWNLVKAAFKDPDSWPFIPTLDRVLEAKKANDANSPEAAAKAAHEAAQAKRREGVREDARLAAMERQGSLVLGDPLPETEDSTENTEAA